MRYVSAAVVLILVGGLPARIVCFFFLGIDASYCETPS
jgi:hypothetical protein